MIPVILIHVGNHDYMNLAAKQAAKFNEVVLIGNAPLDIPEEKVKFESISQFVDGFDDFKNSYVHLNTTPYDYEVFCFHRWFILKNYMERNDLDTVFYIDSDVLLFVNVEQEAAKFEQYEMTLLHRTAAISSFITLNGLRNFCQLLLSTYGNKDGYPFKKIASHFNTRKECNLGGGVCDMTLLEYFHYNSEVGGGPGRVGEMMQIIDSSTYDHNINVADNDYSMKNGIKDVHMVGGIPYVFNQKLKRDIRFNSLHFQGGAKHLMRNIYDQSKQ